MSSAREVELKMRLEPDDVSRFTSFDPIKGIEPTQTHFHTVYFDDPKHDLAQQGFELRIRTEAFQRTQTLKRGSGIDRGEWETEVHGEAPSLDLIDGDVASSILKFGASLQPVFSLDVFRRRWTLHRDNAVIEVALDTGVLMAGDRHVFIREVELELKKGATRSLFALADEFSRQFDAPVSLVSKGERGYRCVSGRGIAPEHAIHLQLDPDISVQTAFQQICYACLRQFSINEECLRGAGDPEAVHQARVAIRRLRAAFSMFKAYVVGADADEVRARVKWISDLLGEARDLDVFLKERLKTVIRQHPRVPGLQALKSEIEARRDAAHNQLREAIHSERFRAFLLSTIRCIYAGQWLRSDDARHMQREQRFESFAKRELERRLTSIANKKKIIAGDHALKLHKLRIKVKKLRYMFEFMKPIASHKQLERTSSHLEELQDLLGAINDSIAAERLLGRIAQEVGNHSITFAAGLVRQHGSAPIKALTHKAVKVHSELLRAKRVGAYI